MRFVLTETGRPSQDGGGLPEAGVIVVSAGVLKRGRGLAGEETVLS